MLGVEVGDSESGAFWTSFFQGLRGPGLDGVQLVISDHHLGLKTAIESVFVGAAWQRCRVHFMRNVLARVPKASVEMVAAAIRTIFAQPNADHVRSQLDEVTAMLAPKFPDVAAMLTDATEDLLAFVDVPSSALAQDLVDEPPRAAQRRDQATHRTSSGIFPNDAAVARLVTAVIVETHDEWAVAERRYLSEGSMAKLYATDTDQADTTKEPPLAITRLVQRHHVGPPAAAQDRLTGHREQRFTGERLEVLPHQVLDLLLVQLRARPHRPERNERARRHLEQRYEGPPPQRRRHPTRRPEAAAPVKTPGPRTNPGCQGHLEAGLGRAQGATAPGRAEWAVRDSNP